MIAVDTNVLFYSVNRDEPDKGKRAADLLRSLDPDQTVMLWQVVCEFGAVVDRRNRRRQAAVDGKAAIDMWLGMYRLVTPSKAALATGWKIYRTMQVAYWDAMLLGACVEAGVTTLYSEDSQSAKVIEGVHLVNPFA